MESENDLKVGYLALKRASRQAKVFNNYYDGDQPLIYTHERLKEVFGRDKAIMKFVINWCCVVIDSALDRLVFKGWDSENQSTNIQLDEFFKLNKFQQLSKKVFKDALITGDGYIIFDMVDGVPTPYWNSPEELIVIYKNEDYSQKAFAVKQWKDEITEITHLNFYYERYIEKYVATKPVNYNSFSLLETVPNPFNKIPVVHFALDQLELANVLPIQNAINKTFSDMMVIGEFGAFPQRWAITNADIDALTSSPASIMGIPKGASDEENTQVGQFESANLNMYLETMDKLANSIAIITRTPKHYFMPSGANVSGEALMVMESPLIKKCEQFQENFSESLNEVAEFVVEDSEITTVWGRIQTEQIETNARVMEILKRLGIPLMTIVRRMGWGQDEVDQMMKDMAEQAEKDAEIAKNALALAEIQFRANNNPDQLSQNNQ